MAQGPHRLSAQWQGRSTDVGVEGQAGDLRVVELNGAGWAWGTRSRWEAARLDQVKSRALASTLVADLDLRR